MDRFETLDTDDEASENSTMQGNTEQIEEDVPLREQCLNHWHETWNEFKRALVSTEDFNALHWTVKLFKAGIGAFYFTSGLDRLKIHVYWRSWIPALAIILIVLVVVSYFGGLREVVRERWCCINNNSCPEGCRWLLFHDAVVVYLGGMILFQYLSACFSSPGVVLPNQDDKSQETTHANGRIQTRVWSSKDSRGGFCGINPALNVAKEAWLVQNYFDLASSRQFSGFPGTEETFCNKCNIKRPPRCRHCSVCNRWYVPFALLIESPTFDI